MLPGKVTNLGGGDSPGKDKNKLRNIFDQYSQHENRLTHALVSALAEDPSLMRKFIRWITGVAPPKRLSIVEQQLPGEYELSEQEYEQRGLPDAWIHDDDEWSLLIESKVSAKLSRNQLERHYRTAKKRGFGQLTVLAIDIEKPSIKLPSYVAFRSWKEIYRWLSQQSISSAWAKQTLRYMEIAERKWPTEGYLKEGTLTEFSGLHFDENSPYNYLEGKRLIRMVMGELRYHPELKALVNSKVGGRDAITGKGRTSVWDYLRLSGLDSNASHTSQPHVSISIGQDSLKAFLLIPNSMKPKYRKPIKELGEEEFIKVIAEVNKNMRSVVRSASGAYPYASMNQRRFPSRAAKSIIDGSMIFDLRTAFGGSRDQPVKLQPQWLSAMYSIMENKRSHMEFGVGVHFPYAYCKKVQSSSIVDSLARSWLACKPLIDVMLK